MAGDDKSQTPAWQTAQESESASSAATLSQARKFLDDEAVRNSSKEKKLEFLKSKGLEEADIEKLLSEDSQSGDRPTEAAKKDAGPQSETSTQEESAESRRVPASTSTPSDTPPIITYPEFLTHSPRPPPLLTPSRLLNIVAASGTAWTLLYGLTHFIVSPMVDTLNESRSDYNTHVNARLSELVEKLEGVVSEVPYKKGTLVQDGDDNSSYDDPTELFSRDIGTQTTPQVFPEETYASTSTESPVDAQARRLAQLSSSLRDLVDMYTHRAEDREDLHTKLRDIRADVDRLAMPMVPDYSMLFNGSNYGRPSEPDDEIKKTKDAIRSVKGLFLSSRMFPTAASSR